MNTKCQHTWKNIIMQVYTPTPHSIIFPWIEHCDSVLQHDEPQKKANGVFTALSSGYQFVQLYRQSQQSKRNEHGDTMFHVTVTRLQAQEITSQVLRGGCGFVHTTLKLQRKASSALPLCIQVRNSSNSLFNSRIQILIHEWVHTLQCTYVITNSFQVNIDTHS